PITGHARLLSRWHHPWQHASPHDASDRKISMFTARSVAQASESLNRLDPRYVRCVLARPCSLAVRDRGPVPTPSRQRLPWRRLIAMTCERPNHFCKRGFEMINRMLLALMAIACVLNVHAQAVPEPPGADLIVLNAKIYTGNPAQAEASALAVKSG